LRIEPVNIPSTEISAAQRAEMALVGLLTFPGKVDEYHAAREAIAPGDIEHEPTRLVYEAIGEVLAAGADVLPLTLADALRKRRVKSYAGDVDGLTAAGGERFIFKLTDAAEFDYRSTIRLVAKNAAARRVKALADELYQLSAAGLDAADLLAQTEGLVMEATATKSASAAPLQLVEIVRQAAQEAQTPLDRSLLGIPTGSRRLDKITNGFLPGKLYVMVGRPGSGKSAKAFHHGYAAAASGYWAHMFSLEMPEDEIGVRALANLASIDTYDIMRRLPLDVKDETNIKQAVECAAVPFTFDTEIFDFDRIVSRARALARQGCRLFIFDYLLLFETARRFERDEMRLAHYTRTLKQLAKQCKVPVICLTQYKAEGADEIPQKSHIYGGSQIENNADYIELMFSPVRVGEVQNLERFFDAKKETYELISGIVAKHRGGRTGRVNYMFKKKFAHYEDFYGEIKAIKGHLIQPGDA
jgi:replicative DNA helicase